MSAVTSVLVSARYATCVIVGMRMFCDVQRSDGTRLLKVPTPQLQPLAACRPGALVVHTQCHWLGRVDEVYDNGPILLQRWCPVEATDSASDLAARVFDEELIALPEALRRFWSR